MSTTTTTGTLAAGESKTFTLAPGAAVSLTLSPNPRVTITETPESVSGSGVGGNTSRVHEPQLPGTFAYGPYAMGGVVVVAVASNSGSSVAWTRKDTVVTTSSDGSSLVSGDGTTISFAGPAYTFAGLPSASSNNAGFSARVTDIGPAGAGSVWISDGSQWAPLNGRALVAKASIPMIMPSSGSMGNNGAITLTTALDKTYAKCYLYLPASAISAGSAAGWYYTEMAGTTTGVVYNNTYTSGRPSIPTSNTAFATTGPGAYTQTTGSDLVALNATIPAGALGLYGGLEFFSSIIVNNTAGVKTLKGFYGATAFMILTAQNNTWANPVGGFSNSGQAAVQRQLTQDFSLGLVGGATYAPTTGVIDSTASQVASIKLKLATATDYIILQGTRVEIVGF